MSARRGSCASDSTKQPSAKSARGKEWGRLRVAGSRGRPRSRRWLYSPEGESNPPAGGLMRSPLERAMDFAFPWPAARSSPSMHPVRRLRHKGSSHFASYRTGARWSDSADFTTHGYGRRRVWLHFTAVYKRCLYVVGWTNEPMPSRVVDARAAARVAERRMD